MSPPGAWLGAAQWPALVSLFVLALGTVGLYLAQWALSRARPRRPRRAPQPPAGPHPHPHPHPEWDALLGWALTLGSWRGQWQAAWVRALNREAGRRAGPPQLHFREPPDPEPLQLTVQRVSSVSSTAREKVLSCVVLGSGIQFLVSAGSSQDEGSRTYGVRLSPLQLQLRLYLQEGRADVPVRWSCTCPPEARVTVQPGPPTEDSAAEAGSATDSLKVILKQLVSSACPSVVLSAQPVDRREVQSLQHPPAAPQEPCPPKPPRAHELKLSVKNLRVSLLPSAGLPAALRPRCQLRLDDPQQSFSGVLEETAMALGWQEELIFELSAKSKELCLQLSGDQSSSEALAAATVPLDLFRKRPAGPQSFPLTGLPSPGGPVLGQLTAEFSYLEPTDAKAWLGPVVSTVEKDREVMPCGTVVTTLRAVKTKPRPEAGRASPLCSESPLRTPVKVKVIEKDIEVQAVTCHAPVSKTLSSSDTELLVLTGSDPVAEAAIRQLSQGSGLRLRTPRKKSTLIISGVSKTSLSQDAAVKQDDDPAPPDGPPQEDAAPAPPEVPPEAPPEPAPPEDEAAATAPLPREAPDSELDSWDPERDPPVSAWGSPARQDPEGDQLSESSLSTSESGVPKKHKGGFLRRGAKFFFRRWPPQREAGLSQSCSDLAPQSPQAAPRRKGTTLGRVLHRRLLTRSRKSQAHVLPADPQGPA